MATEATHRPMPPGILVRASRHDIARCFGVLAALQPAAWTADGLICAPRAAPEIAAPALDACPFPMEILDRVPTWLAPHAMMVAGWYRRSPGHAPGPDPTRELVQVDGDGFGPLGHPTTEMCLAAMRHLHPSPALDVGCGSGLLAQAWARQTQMPVCAIDADPTAVGHARQSIDAADLSDLIDVRHAHIAGLTPAQSAGRALLANVPAAAHVQLLQRVAGKPTGAVLSGLTSHDWLPIVRAWIRRDMRIRAAAGRGRWRCVALVPR